MTDPAIDRIGCVNGSGEFLISNANSADFLRIIFWRKPKIAEITTTQKMSNLNYLLCNACNLVCWEHEADESVYCPKCQRTCKHVQLSQSLDRGVLEKIIEKCKESIDEARACINERFANRNNRISFNASLRQTHWGESLQKALEEATREENERFGEVSTETYDECIVDFEKEIAEAKHLLRREKEEKTRLEREAARIELAQKEEKSRLEREAARIKLAQKEEKERLEREAAALKQAEKERLECEASDAVTKTFSNLYGPILALDKFVASFQDKLGQIDDARKQCDAAFGDEKSRAKRQFDTAFETEQIRFNHEKNNIDGHLRSAQAAIDRDLEDKRRQLDNALADIDRDVQSHRDRGIARFDNDLAQSRNNFHSRIAELEKVAKGGN